MSDHIVAPTNIVPYTRIVYLTYCVVYLRRHHSPLTMTKRSEDAIAEDIRIEVSKAIEDNQELLDILIRKVKGSLIEEITAVITKKMTETIEERLEFDLAERDDKIKELEKEIDRMKDKQDEADQYSRRNCLIVHGIPEKEGESTDALIKDLCSKKLKVQLEGNEIDRSHRLGAKKGKVRGIIVKLTNYRVRDRIYQARKMLRNTEEENPVYIQESLTKLRGELFWEIKSNYKQIVKNIWTQDGRIQVRLHDDRRLTFVSKVDLKKLKTPNKS